MARVEVAGDQLTVQIKGMDRLWAFKSRLEIPLAHVRVPRLIRRWRAAGRVGAARERTFPASSWPGPSTTRVTGSLGRARCRQGGVTHLADERYARGRSSMPRTRPT
jgi:hypothetical protein